MKISIRFRGGQFTNQRISHEQACWSPLSLNIFGANLCGFALVKLLKAELTTSDDGRSLFARRFRKINKTRYAEWRSALSLCATSGRPRS